MNEEEEFRFCTFLILLGNLTTWEAAEEPMQF